jgi:hypothetical protein
MSLFAEDYWRTENPAPPPSNSAEISFTALQVRYMQFLFKRKLDEIVDELGPLLMADFGDGVKAAYPARKVEEVLRKHLGIINHG